MTGYFATALFVVYSISNIFGILNIKESGDIFQSLFMKTI